MVYNQFSIFHKVILAFFILIFLGGCGHKGDPFYSVDDKPQNTSKTEKINKL